MILTSLFAAMAALAVADAPAAGGYELRLSEENGVRTIAVSGGAGRLAAARGGETLDLLPRAEAEAAWKAFAMPDAPDVIAWKSAAGDGEEDIVIHRREKKTGADADETVKKEKRVIIHKSGEESDEEIVRLEDSEDVVAFEDDDLAFLGDDEEGRKVRRIVRIEKDGDGAADGELRRFIRIDGAKAKDAARFIDDAKGLDAAERTAMKKAAGV
jgi:hypothetical protein